jgi:hypothetical protein
MSGGEIRNKICVSYINIKRLVVPAWTAGTQVDMDMSGRIRRAWMPAFRTGTTRRLMAILRLQKGISTG